jgi:hypothetical protein
VPGGARSGFPCKTGVVPTIGVPRVFLLSPASCKGERARILTREEAAFDLASRLREPQGAPLGEVFAFLSGLYFRGKITYARAFARPPAGVPGILVITPDEGLRIPEEKVDLARLKRYAAVNLGPDEPRYVGPILRDARSLARRLKEDCDVILLGSIATAKYLDVLGDALGHRLCFPAEFVGRGDMSRGALMLRHAAEGREMDYVRGAAASRHGPRPPRLVPASGRRNPPKPVL